jgi:hypothetical protein
MSDHDRGAYTPKNDAPLSFDARQARGRRAFPTTLVISLVILAGLGGAIFMFYRSGVRGAGDAPTPVGAPIGEIKAPAPAQTQPPTDAAAGLQIYKAEGSPAAPASAPVFAAGPEQPLPRPAPTTPAVVAASGATTKPAPAAMTASPPAEPKPVVVAEAKPAPAPVAVKPAPVAKAKPAATDDIGALLSAKAPAPKAVPTKPAPAAEAKAAPQPATPVSHGAAVAQFGAFSSAALAASEWAKLAKAYPGDMAGKGRLVESVERDGKTLYRGAVSGFASRADAVAFCATLKADSRGCIVR